MTFFHPLTITVSTSTMRRIRDQIGRDKHGQNRIEDIADALIHEALAAREEKQIRETQVPDNYEQIAMGGYAVGWHSAVGTVIKNLPDLTAVQLGWLRDQKPPAQSYWEMIRQPGAAMLDREVSHVD